MKRLLIVLLLTIPLHADEVAKLHAIFDRSWEAALKDDPLYATSVGRHEYGDLLPSITAADLKRQHDRAKATLTELKSVDRSKLPASEAVNYDMLRRNLEDAITSYELGDYQITLNADSGFHTSFSRLPKDVPLATTKDYENYIARLKAWPRYVREQVAHMKAGLTRGMSVPRVTLEGYESTITAHVLEDPSKSVFYAPFEKFPTTIPASDHDRLRREGRVATEA